MQNNQFSHAESLSKAIGQPLLKFAHNTFALINEGEFWVFVDRNDISSPADLKENAEIYDIQLPDSVSAVYYVLINWIPIDQEKVSLALGRSGVSVRFALRKLLDLPSTFDASQEAAVHEALGAIKALGVNPIGMTLVSSNGERHLDASKKLAEMIQLPQVTGGGLFFVEAEAGKGKTILLASVIQSMREDKRGRLPIYIALRKLPLSAGVSWESITQLIGVVGEGSERLVRAVKAGLVTIVLDGIDEVAGRYDKNLIRDLLEVMTNRLGSQQSFVILSGRRTEARHLDAAKWEILNIELPDLISENFRNYVGSVLDGLIQQSRLLVEVPDEYVDLIGNRPADDQVSRERDSIVSWILDVFPEVAKETSLFFVQGLAAIAIGRRSGNRAPLRDGDSRPYLPPIWDVCLSAAVFACIRECSKIDSVATDKYSVKSQMRALQGLAALASASSLANNPTPNELVPEAFRVDPVNSPEVYVAITRQNAKHALLYATEAAGGYRPQFLSEWIRCSLIAQIFSGNPPLGKLSRADILKLAVSSERAKYTFDTLLPSMLEIAKEQVHAEWLAAFSSAILAGSESASANQWTLRAALGDERLGATISNPLPLADVMDIEFSGFTIDGELSGNDFMLDGTQFVNSSISNVKLQAVSMQAVTFMNCEISNFELVDCDGPVTFEDCKFSNLKISNAKSSSAPALTFESCDFLGDDNRINQEKPPYGPDKYVAMLEFRNCLTESGIDGLVTGDWACNERPLKGISEKQERSENRAEACLRRALRAFFPSHIGSDGALQARPYIRLSALGRGSVPEGSPGQAQLQQIFEAVGFTTGGRSDHLYGPWSSVVGASASGVALRNELVEFMLDITKQGASISKMIERIESYFPSN